MIVADIPETRYAETNVGRIAYQIVGDGPVDLLVAHPANFPIDLMWDEPRLAGFLNGLSGFSRHIWFDPRGRGASDRPATGEDRLAESMVEDMVGLLDALGLEQVALLGMQFAGPLLPLFAASHPERTTALVMFNVSAGLVRSEVPAADQFNELLEARVADVRRGWGTTDGMRHNAPSLAGDRRYLAWAAKAERLNLTPDASADRLRTMAAFNSWAVLGAVKVPTLVLCRPASMGTPRGAQYLADRIVGSTYIELPGEDFLFFAGDNEPILDAIEEFLTGELPKHDTDRVLATVLFTDIVGSTDHLARVGDRIWKATLTAHDSLIARKIEQHRGRQVKTTGDGVLATFDGPGRAVRCAQAIVESVRSLGVEVRAGVHTGEIELRGDDVGGIGVHIAARVSSLAGPSEVLVSRTVTDLVAGSGIEFDDRGEQELKGVPGTWRVYSVLA
ncbi:MAG: adenylate/guanylate cyclase domain-containing protein [Acidimicrobiales bacterium]